MQLAAPLLPELHVAQSATPRVAETSQYSLPHWHGLAVEDIASALNLNADVAQRRARFETALPEHEEARRGELTAARAAAEASAGPSLRRVRR